MSTNDSAAPSMSDDEIVAQCLQYDARPATILYFLETDRRSMRLGWFARQWGSLDGGERFCAVKNQSFFLTEAEAVAAVGRALMATRPQ